MKKFRNSVKVGNYGFFLAAMLLFGMAFGLFKGVQDNYLAEILKVDPLGRGIVEFFRELPGLLLLLILALFYKTPENRILKYAFMISLAGIVGLYFSKTNLPLFVLFLTIWSAGEHLMMPVRQSYAVHSSLPGKEGTALGIARSLGNMGQVAGYFLVPLVFLLFGLAQGETDLGVYRVVLAIVILVVAVALLLTFKLNEQTGHVKRGRLYFRKKYTKFYFLEVFYGGRKQVFLTFAPYVLILHYGASTELIATLLGTCAVINIFFTPIMGKIIDRMGYKLVMVLDTVFLFFVCLTYGFAHRIFPEQIAFYVVCGTFILDWMISNASMAASVYVSRISDNREEMTSTLSTGISINHVISVAIALAGGLIWNKLGIELLFILAALMAVGNSLFAMTIPVEKAQITVKE
jgi:MFS family permease